MHSVALTILEHFYIYLALIHNKFHSVLGFLWFFEDLLETYRLKVMLSAVNKMKTTNKFMIH